MVSVWKNWMRCTKPKDVFESNGTLWVNAVSARLEGVDTVDWRPVSRKEVHKRGRESSLPSNLAFFVPQRLVIVVDEDVEDECGCEVIESKCERSLSLQFEFINGNVGRLLGSEVD